MTTTVNAKMAGWAKIVIVIITDSPLPPVLIPLSWLLGVWQVHVKGFRNRAYDYPFDFDASGYNETLSFTVAKAVMFGTPSINFTSESISDDDPSNVHCHNGFMTIRQYAPNGDNAEKAALMTVNNVVMILGVAFVEEGDILKVERSNGWHLNLVPVYMNVKEELKDKVPTKLARSFVRKGSKLMQLITKEEKGRTLKFTKIYNRIKEFQFL
uniref:DUF1794 domain-containing protein n=1 Tax=Heterorhabditis bacteriophora TaxID=37862 RepID=A0A1I7XV85_HETBA